LTPDTKVYPLLGFSGPADFRSDNITIQECLDHQAGFDRIKSSFDPVFKMREIAKSLGLSRPPTQRDIATYMYKNRMLDYEPGTLYCYSTYGYLLAGMVVQKLSGISFIDYVNQKVLQSAGLAPVRIFPTAEGTQASDEPPYEDDLCGLTADPHEQPDSARRLRGRPDDVGSGRLRYRHRLLRRRTGAIYPSLQSLGQRHPGPVEFTAGPLQIQGREHARHFFLGRVAVGRCGLGLYF
jgi:CubicO group peptidase (beta-lactamase class C family)